MKKTIILSFISLLSVLTLASCKVERIDKDRGPVKTFAVDAKDFNGINISYPAKVTYIPSDTFSVTVKAAEKDRENTIIRVKDGVLQISPEGTWGEKKKYLIFNSNHDDMEITVKAPSISSVNIAGSGVFKCNTTMKAPHLLLSIVGSGDIDIKNIEAKLVSAGIVGSGDINVGVTNASKAEAKISGSGDIDMKCHNCDDVVADISGSGDITLSGNTKSLDKSVSGSGDIHTEELTVKK